MSEHTDIGAYSLGLLEEPDRLAFEDHLAGCQSCAAELAELSPMAGLLRGIEPAGTGDGAAQAEAAQAEAAQAEAAEARATEAGVTDLLRRRAAQQRRRRRWQVALGAAAGIALIAGGTGIGLAAAPQHASTPAAVVLTGQLHSATAPGTGVTGTVGLTAKPWGTQVTMDLSTVRGPLECELVAVSRTGERRVVAGWLVPAAGYGVPGHPAHLLLEGGTSIALGDLAHIDVDVLNGRTLVSIPV